MQRKHLMAFTLFQNLLYFLILSLVISNGATDVDEKISSSLKNKLDSHDTKIRNQQNEYLKRVEKKINATRSKFKPLQLTNAPFRMIKIMDKSINELASTRSKPLFFEPLSGFSERIQENVDQLVQHLVDVNDQFLNEVHEGEEYFATLESMVRHYCSSMIFDASKTFNTSDLKENKKIIKKVIELKLDNLKNNGTGIKKEINNIKQTARILANEYTTISIAEFKKWKKSYHAEFRLMMDNCAKAQTNAREINRNLSQLTNKMQLKWNVKVKETREKLQQLDLLSTIVDIKKKSNGENITYDLNTICPLLGNRKGKEVNLGNITDSSGKSVLMLYEQQQKSKDFDTVVLTFIKSEEIVQIDNWLIEYYQKR